MSAPTDGNAPTDRKVERVREALASKQGEAAKGQKHVPGADSTHGDRQESDSAEKAAASAEDEAGSASGR